MDIEYFEPVVEEGNNEVYKKDLYERENREYCWYVLILRIKYVYPVAELVGDSNKRSKRTLFCFLEKYGNKEFDTIQVKSMMALN